MTEWNPTGKWNCLQSLYILDLSDADYLDAEEAVVLFWMQYSIEQYGIYPTHFYQSPDILPFICSSHF
jgi:hypothetical protein